MPSTYAYLGVMSLPAFPPCSNAPPCCDLLDPCLGKAQPPFGITEASLTARPMGIFCHGLLCRIGPIGDQIPAPPLAMLISLPAHRHPQRLRVTGTIEQTPQRATARMACKAQRVEPAPDAGDTELGAFLDADHERHPQVGQQRAQRHSGEATIRPAHGPDGASPSG